MTSQSIPSQCCQCSHGRVGSTEDGGICKPCCTDYPLVKGSPVKKKIVIKEKCNVIIINDGVTCKNKMKF